MKGDHALLLRHERLFNIGGLAAAIVTVFAAWFFVWRPIESEIKTTRTRLAAQAQFITTSSATIEKEAAIHKQVADLQKKHDAVLARIPDAAQANEFLHHLDDLAKESDFAIRNYTPRETAVHSAWSVQNFRVTGQGSFAAICRFLIALENQQRLSRIHDLSISKNKDAKTCTLTMSVAAYYAMRQAEVEVKGVVR